MRKSWSAKSNTRLGLSKSTRLLLAKDQSKSIKIRPNLVSSSTVSLVRPITAASALGTSRFNGTLSLPIEIEGLNSEEVKRIYIAKCKDLEISYLKDQEQRFFNFCNKSFANRIINLNENGLGLESVKALSAILKKNVHFCRVSLSKNNIGEAGAIYLANSLKKNNNVISIDISSNDINPEGLCKFFEVLQNSKSLVNMNVCSLEGLHRNRLGVRGAESLSDYLKVNRILTHLNISDTGIGKEGLEYISQGLAQNDILVYLDISNNGFTHQSLEDFCKVLVTTQLKELSLSGNKIGNKGAEIVAKLLGSRFGKTCTLTKLDLSACEISINSIAKLSESLENNPNLAVLSLDSNVLGPYSGAYLGKFLTLNSALQVLSLNNCDLRDEGVIKLFEGLCKNNALKKIFLIKNIISDAAITNVSECIIKNNSLVTIDLSSNFIKNSGGMMIANSLRRNSTLENLLLNENSLKDESGRLLSEVSRFKNNLLKIDLGMNPINLKYINEIKENLSRNNFNYKQLLSPRLKKEIEKLTLTDRDIEKVFNEISDKAKEKIDFEDKVLKQKSKLQNIIVEENDKYQVLLDEHNELKEKNQDLSKKLESLFYESNRTKVQSEKMIKEISDSIAYTVQDIKKLEKQKALLKEEFGLKRSQLNYVFSGLQHNSKDTMITYNSAIGSYEIAKLKLKEVLDEIDSLKNPPKEEVKTRKKKKTVRSGDRVKIKAK